MTIEKALEVYKVGAKPILSAKDSEFYFANIDDATALAFLELKKKSGENPKLAEATRRLRREFNRRYERVGVKKPLIEALRATLDFYEKAEKERAKDNGSTEVQET